MRGVSWGLPSICAARDRFSSFVAECYGVAMNIPDGWTTSADGVALAKSFRFADFSKAFAFLTRVAMHAEKVDHHPEFTSVWDRVDFRLTSHDSGGITDRDTALAEAIDRLASQ
jgi:4a-hydroxytetrahydrobiopterin dehydratase